MVVKSVNGGNMFKKILILGVAVLIQGCVSNDIVMNNESYISAGQIKPEMFSSYIYNKFHQELASDGLSVDRNSSSVLLTIQDDLVFEQNSSIIKKDFERKLNNIASTALLSDLSKVRIIVHSDNQGNYFDNINKTSDKAFAIKDYFVKKGIKETNITYFGVASKQPLYDNETEENRRKNRRVEIDIENELQNN
jgi:flagellar motor protein MotB